MGRDSLLIAIAIAVVMWIAWDVRERRPISTSEWRKLMRKHGIGVKKAA